MKVWSTELQSETRRVLCDMPPAVFAFNERLGRKGVVLKRIGGGSGYITLQSCLNEKYVVQGHESDEVIGSFPNLQSLLDAGWAVD